MSQRAQLNETFKQVGQRMGVWTERVPGLTDDLPGYCSNMLGTIED